MLAFMYPPPNTVAPPHAYAPTRSSPLTPRDPNAHLSRSAFQFAHKHGMNAESPQDAVGKPAAAPVRDARPNPLIQRSGSDAVRERRRDMFLRRVANDRDDRRWAARSEQILKLDYQQQQRRWEAEMARRAPQSAEPPSDEEDNQNAMQDDQEGFVIGSSQATNWSFQRPRSQQQGSDSLEQEVDVVASQEDAELQALVDLMQEDEQDDEQTFQSDDEYDVIFDQAINAPPNNTPGPPRDTVYSNDDDMDMTG